MPYADIWLPLAIGILGIVGWLARGRSLPHTSSAKLTDGDDPDHNHGSRL
jgi:hypothetical protein